MRDALQARAADARSKDAAEVAFGVIVSLFGKDPKDDLPPPRPEGVHTESEPPSYSKMLATLLDQVNKALDEKKPADRYSAMVDEIGVHLRKVQDLQEELLKKLAELEKEEKKKITSESYHTGFDSSHVTKAEPSVSTENPTQTVELLNPDFKAALDQGGNLSSSSSGPLSSTNPDEVEASPAAKTFGAIKAGDYRASVEFLSKHPQILTEAETDGLLVLAFEAALDGKEQEARNLVHQALLLQYARALGRDGVAIFFKRITTKGHKAQEIFFADVQDRYGRIIGRSREILAERAKAREPVEQIQLQTVEPGTKINIRVPPVIADDAEIEGLEKIADDEEREEARRRVIAQVQHARKIFDGFPADFRTALESGSLEEVNKVLGEMNLEEAEAIVGQLSDVSFFFGFL